MVKGSITIVGLGPGSAGQLSLETMAKLQQGEQVILRTIVHPSVKELEKQQVSFLTCDSFYETEESFEAVYEKIVAFIIQEAQTKQVVYAVPGSPLVAERTVVLLREQAKLAEIEINILPSMSFLDLAYVQLGIDPISGLRVIDAGDLDAVAEAGRYPLMITQVYSKMVASDLKISLMEVLEDETEVWFLRNLGLPNEECHSVLLYELDRQPEIDHLTSVFIPRQEKQNLASKVATQSEMDVNPLIDILKTLREPGGCIWDREQTHTTIRRSMIEEVYELLEAIDNKDYQGIREELGDVLLQVVFHARLAEEAGAFTMQEIVAEIVEKLIRRHPHVFGTIEVGSSEEVLQNWDAIKKVEKTDRVHALDGVSPGLPALMRAYKLQSKAAKVGFDWDCPAQVWTKVEEEIGELQEAVAEGDLTHIEQELGDVLFALAGYAKHLQLEPETALNGTNNRFKNRFSYIEQKVVESGKKWQEFTLKELDQLWSQAKKLERNK